MLRELDQRELLDQANVDRRAELAKLRGQLAWLQRWQAFRDHC